MAQEAADSRQREAEKALLRAERAEMQAALYQSQVQELRAELAAAAGEMEALKLEGADRERVRTMRLRREQKAQAMDAQSEEVATNVAALTAELEALEVRTQEERLHPRAPPLEEPSPRSGDDPSPRGGEEALLAAARRRGPTFRGPLQAGKVVEEQQRAQLLLNEVVRDNAVLKAAYRDLVDVARMRSGVGGAVGANEAALARAEAARLAALVETMLAERKALQQALLVYHRARTAQQKRKE